MTGSVRTSLKFGQMPDLTSGTGPRPAWLPADSALSRLAAQGVGAEIFAIIPAVNAQIESELPF
jgi:hypothetical protein